MNKGLTKDVWLYFNNEADNDNIATSTNGCWPAQNLVNMAPTGDSLLSLYFKSMMNKETNGAAEEVIHDVVTLSLTTANTHLAAMTAIVQAINNTRPSFGVSLILLMITPLLLVVPHYQELLLLVLHIHTLAFWLILVLLLALL